MSVECTKTAPSLLPLVVFLANTGARRGEALALTWNHVDLEHRIIKIWPSEGDDDDDPWEPKNRRPREVPISDRLLPWLSGPRLSKRWVFPAPATGKRYAYWPENQWQRAQKLANLSGGIHTLRHTYASHFLQAEADLFLLAKILGHSHTRVTELYAHLLPAHLERGRNAVSLTPDVGPAIAKARRRWRKAEVLSSDAPRVRRNVR